MRRAALLAAVLAGSLAHADPRTADAVATTADGFLSDPFLRSGFDRRSNASVFDFRADRTGGSWYGAPTASWDCIGEEWTSGNWGCHGATFAPQNSPVAGKPTPFYPSGFSSAGSKAVGLNGTSQYFDGGNIAAPAGSFTACAVFRGGVAAGQVIASKYAAAGGSWNLYATDTSLRLFVFKSGGTGTVIIGPGVTNTAWNVGCAAYQWVADGTSIERINTNGTAGTTITNAVGPPQASAVEVHIGHDHATSYFNGAIHRVTFWDGWAASATQLDAMVRSYWGMLPAKGGPLTVTRAAPQSVNINGANQLFYVPNNVLASSEAGAQIYGAYTVLNANSEDMSMASKGTVTVTVNQAVAPDGNQTADQVDFTAGVNSYIYYRSSGVTQGAQHTCSWWAWAPTGTQTFRLWRTNTTTWGTATVSPTLTATTTPQRFTLQYMAETGETQSDCGVGGESKTPWAIPNGSLYLWGHNHAVGALKPYVVTTTSQVAQPATVVSTATPPSGKTAFCSLVQATHPAWTTSTGDQTAFAYGPAGTANFTYLSLHSGAQLGLGVVDGAGYTRLAYYTPSPAWGAGTAHKLVGCAAGSVNTLTLDGVTVPASLTGAGTGLAAVPATSYVGSGTGALYFFNGSLSRAALCNSSSPLRCK